MHLLCQFRNLEIRMADINSTTALNYANSNGNTALNYADNNNILLP